MAPAQSDPKHRRFPVGPKTIYKNPSVSRLGNDLGDFRVEVGSREVPERSGVGSCSARLDPETRPLSRALQKVWVFRFFDPGPGASGGPWKAPLGYPWVFPGPPGASRRPPGPKTKQSKKPRNLKELTEQWRSGGAKNTNAFAHSAIWAGEPRTWAPKSPT